MLALAMAAFAVLSLHDAEQHQLLLATRDSRRVGVQKHHTGTGRICKVRVTG